MNILCVSERAWQNYRNKQFNLLPCAFCFQTNSSDPSCCHFTTLSALILACRIPLRHFSCLMWVTFLCFVIPLLMSVKEEYKEQKNKKNKKVRASLVVCMGDLNCERCGDDESLVDPHCKKWPFLTPLFTYLKCYLKRKQVDRTHQKGLIILIVLEKYFLAFSRTVGH